MHQDWEELELENYKTLERLKHFLHIMRQLKRSDFEWRQMERREMAAQYECKKEEAKMRLTEDCLKKALEMQRMERSLARDMQDLRKIMRVEASPTNI